MHSLDSPRKDSLYRRLGGYDVIAAVIDEFLSRFGGDPGLARFGGGRSLDSRQRTRQLIVDQVCSLAGGPCVYTGRDMKEILILRALPVVSGDAEHRKLDRPLLSVEVRALIIVGLRIENGNSCCDNSS